jgi:hypothetical protein
VPAAAVFYLSKPGKKPVGYNALLLPDAVNVYLDFRTSPLAEGKRIPAQYAPTIARRFLRLGGSSIVDCSGPN